MWVKTQEKRLIAEKSDEYKSDFFELRKEISNIIRDLRKQIDQYLIKNNYPVVFGNKIRFYDKEEFLYDAEINFYQLKRFLTYKSSVLKNDPSIAKNYADLMEAITRKKIIENSIANFERSDFYNPEQDKLDNEEDNQLLNEVYKLETEEKASGEIQDIAKMAKEKLEEETSSDFRRVKSQNKQKKLMKEREKKLKKKILDHFEQKVKEALGSKEDTKKADAKLTVKPIKKVDRNLKLSAKEKVELKIKKHK